MKRTIISLILSLFVTAYMFAGGGSWYQPSP